MSNALRRLTQSELEQYHQSTYELLEEQRVQLEVHKRKAGSCALLFVEEEAKNKKLEAENTRLAGLVIGKNRTISDLALATYQALKQKSPPSSAGAVCWKTFGEVCMSEMTALGLPPYPSNDWRSGTTWNQGFWLEESRLLAH